MIIHNGYTPEERAILREIERETADTYPITRAFAVKSFISRSNGRGRRPRRPRTVELFYHAGGVLAVNDANMGRIDRAGHDEGITPPPDQNLADYILEHLRRYSL